MRPPRELRKKLPLTSAYAESEGWTPELRHGGHVGWSKPGRATQISPSSPSDRRSDLNCRAGMRREDRAQKDS